MSLKEKTIRGVQWNIVNVLFTHGIQLVVGVILARLLSPEQFGLIGMTAIFTAIAQSFVDSGFSAALIRKKICTQSEYSTVFYYNMLIGIIFYSLLYFAAPHISRFFDEEKLTLLVRVIGVNIVIMGIAQIQRTILIKQMDFKKLTIVTALSSIVSGAISIVMAFAGYGVWSLVFQQLMRGLLESVILWVIGHWRPSFIFCMTAFKELFGFGSKLLASGLLNSIYNNIYNLVIGKYFSASELGYYTRANRFSNLLGPNINTVVQSVTFPAMAEFADNTDRLKANFKRILMSTSLLSIYLSLLMAACARALILTLIGEKWAESIPYLQLLCFATMLFPVHALNLTILKVKGRSDLFLKLEVIKKLLAIPTIVIGVLYGIVAMLLMKVLTSIVALYINAYYTAKQISYNATSQLKDITKSIILTLSIIVPVYVFGQLVDLRPGYELSAQVLIGLIGGICIIMFSKNTGATELRQIALEYVRKIKNKLRR